MKSAASGVTAAWRRTSACFRAPRCRSRRRLSWRLFTRNRQPCEQGTVLSADASQRLQEIEGQRIAARRALAEIQLLGDSRTTDAAKALAQAAEEYQAAEFDRSLVIWSLLNREDSLDSDEEAPARSAAGSKFTQVRAAEVAARTAFIARAQSRLGIDFTSSPPGPD